jgi:hypothetical protein
MTGSHAPSHGMGLSERVELQGRHWVRLAGCCYDLAPDNAGLVQMREELLLLLKLPAKQSLSSLILNACRYWKGRLQLYAGR